MILVFKGMQEHFTFESHVINISKKVIILLVIVDQSELETIKLAELIK